MIVELESGVYLADGEGDPARTILKENAQQFLSMKDACIALTKARQYRPFKGAVIIASLNRDQSRLGRK